ncbi:MAG: hypothetical protein EB143_05185, partial [Actinobacteria bacterium]|nr:hypothetical protein [Actinomycetota bacterium]
MRRESQHRSVRDVQGRAQSPRRRRFAALLLVAALSACASTDEGTGVASQSAFADSAAFADDANAATTTSIDNAPTIDVSGDASVGPPGPQ